MTQDHEPGTSFTTTGGVGSVRYVLGEVSAAGARLGRVASRLEPLVDRLQSEWGLLGSATANAPNHPYAALDAMRACVWSSMRGQAEVADLARRTADAAKNYDAAEAHNAAAAAQKARLGALAAGIQTWTLGPFSAFKFWGDTAATWSHAREYGLRDATEDLLNKGGGYAAGVLGPGLGLFYLLTHAGLPDQAGAGTAAANGARKFFDWAGLSKPGHLEMRKVPAGEWNAQAGDWRPGHAVPDPSEAVEMEVGPQVAGLLAGSQDAYTYPPGSIIVDRLERAGGSHAWIVHLPGTEDWSQVDSENPWDLEGDLEGMTSMQQAQFKQQQIVVQEMMKQALQDAGALPTEDVMITGHSGGGIHAAAAAASPAFLAQVNVKMIIIAGAPAKNQPVAPGIDVLDLENENDIVPALDYGPPPDSANWVTVTSHRPGATEGVGPIGTIKDAHDLGNYIDDAAALERSDDPGIKGARDAAAKFMGAGVGSVGAMRVARTLYQGRDVNDPKPAKPKPPTKKESTSPGYR
ncbi:hypothetical protein CVV68_07785 [Arthrobacter livingstonensis]|uniref:GPI inositol-deacylase PGAP1-like alpha/beta domain-containing protein n=1 Tax=Arthrobacter livingstonensis TaxID=670078 RepID=A0A2V5LBI9_9MICC|nr:hypothetical protein [Arthrobacter livingstonensis]PYI68212.1 hypothetical protein CVV68_07785 [Arthrobacter livingstonensis]